MGYYACRQQRLLLDCTQSTTIEQLFPYLMDSGQGIIEPAEDLVVYKNIRCFLLTTTVSVV